MFGKAGGKAIAREAREGKPPANADAFIRKPFRQPAGRFNRLLEGRKPPCAECKAGILPGIAPAYSFESSIGRVQTTIEIGRGNTNANDLMVSASHGIIEVTDSGRFIYRDSGSTNGSIIVRKSGVVIRLGRPNAAGAEILLDEGDGVFLGSRTCLKVSGGKLLLSGDAALAETGQGAKIEGKSWEEFHAPKIAADFLPAPAMKTAFGSFGELVEEYLRTMKDDAVWNQATGAIEFYATSGVFGPKVHIALPSSTASEHLAYGQLLIGALVGMKKEGIDFSFKFMGGDAGIFRMHNRQFGKDFTLYFGSYKDYLEAEPKLKEINGAYARTGNSWGGMVEKNGRIIGKNAINMESEAFLYENGFVTVSVRAHNGGKIHVDAEYARHSGISFGDLSVENGGAGWRNRFHGQLGASLAQLARLSRLDPSYAAGNGLLPYMSKIGGKGVHVLSDDFLREGTGKLNLFLWNAFKDGKLGYFGDKNSWAAPASQNPNP